MAEDILRLAKNVFEASHELGEREAKASFTRALPEYLRMENPEKLADYINNATQLCLVLDIIEKGYQRGS